MTLKPLRFYTLCEVHARPDHVPGYWVMNFSPQQCHVCGSHATWIYLGSDDAVAP